MNAFKDFCMAVGSQHAAAVLLGVKDYTISRACKTRPSIKLAQRAERATNGRFSAAVLLGLNPPPQIADSQET